MRFWILLLIGGLAAGPASAAAPAARPPNFIVFLCDNLGYADTTPFGSKLHRTPNLERLAAEGRKFTHFYASANVCTPSRAGLMTSSYARRVNIYQNVRTGPVLQPGEPIGLNPSEFTIAEMLKTVGYSTMLIGKWHLGDQPVFLPTRQGFDHYWGVPYSDDMDARPGQPWPPLPLMRDETVIEAPVDRNELTRRETEEAIRFITAEKDRPFFLIISHAMPGSTQASFASAAFRGKSRNGLWGDAVEELDWSAGEVMNALRQLRLDQNTLVVWTSDNPATRRNPPNGSNAPFSGYMGTPTEGGMRVPCIVKWPGHVPAGTVCTELGTLMDLMPTFGRLTGAKIPTDRIIDGKDIWPMMAAEKNAVTPHEAFYYYHFEQLQAVRSGPWKLFLPLKRQRAQVAKAPETVNSAARLYNVVTDPAEASDVATQQPEVVARIEALAERARDDIGDMGHPGKGQRPAGWVFEPEAPRLPGTR
jgi:arylsulfatase A-like enzyme